MQKMIPKLILSGFLMCFIISTFFMCKQKDGDSSSFRQVDSSYGFIDKKFKNMEPIAQLINLPVYKLGLDSFKLKIGSKIHIYAVGELISPLAKVKKKYFLKNEDMEIYFNTDNDKSDFNHNNPHHMQYIFTLVEGYVGGKNSVKDGLEVKNIIDTINNKYLVEIKFPWKNLGIPHPANNLKIGFDIAVASNNHGICQDKKIAWCSSADTMLNTTKFYGTLLLSSGKAVHIDTNYLCSIYKRANDRQVYQSIKVKKAIAGEVKGNHDFYANVKSFWDEQNLFLVIEGNKGMAYYKQRYITPEKIEKLQTFADYGWIEDKKGNTIWKMHVQNSTHAGGAFKNQKIDTVIYLKAGEYILKYNSDESHAYENWDDNPPLTPFYGVKLYRQK